MLDASGKKPSGMVSDTTSVCEFLDFFGSQGCDRNPVLAALNEKRPIPRGDTFAMGTFTQCLGVDAVHTDDSDEYWEEFSGQHCYFKLRPRARANASMEAAPEPRLPFLPTLPPRPEVGVSVMHLPPNTSSLKK